VDSQRSRRLVGAIAAACVSLAVAGPAAARDLSAYRGLGSWVDIYDHHAAKNPQAVVAEMRTRGVQTLYVETSNYSHGDLVRPASLARFIESAHAAGLRVVAWYLPGFWSLKRDLRRSLAAIRFTTPLGEHFDSFALDIEATLVHPIGARNNRLAELSVMLRRAVGRDYPLGAIVPDAAAYQVYWRPIPYLTLSRYFDVFLPMAYWTARVRGAAAVYRYIAANIAAIRQGTGRPDEPVHVIGGLSQPARTSEVSAFVAAVRDGGAIGASLYDFAGTRASAWQALEQVPGWQLPPSPVARSLPPS
jgi:hypothetical protein